MLRYIKETKHYSLSLQPTKDRAKEEVHSLELVAFSACSWTEASRSTSSTYLALWGVPLAASCSTCWAYTQGEAELEGVRLALRVACHTRKLLQHLELDQLSELVSTNLRTTSWHNELVTGRPLAMQLGLSRKHKHIQFDQLRISKVHPQRNLAQSLINTASSPKVLAKLRVTQEAAEIGALTTVRGEDAAFLEGSSSLLVGMIFVEPSPMVQPQLRKPPCFKSGCFAKSFSESLTKTLQSLTVHSLSFKKSSYKSLTLSSWSLPIAILTLLSLSRFWERFQSLTLHNWSFAIDSLYLHSLSLPKDRLHSLTWKSLSFDECNSDSLILHSFSYTEDRLCSLTLQSLSLINQNCFSTMSFKETSFDNGNLEELEKTLAHKSLEWNAGTNSFHNNSFTKSMPAQEVGTNNFFKSFGFRIWSLRMCLLIFLFSSFQLISAALNLETSSFLRTFPTESLQSEELVAASFKDSFQNQNLQQQELQVAYSESPMRAQQLQQHSLEDKELQTRSFQRLSAQLCSTELCNSTLECFSQLDLANSLSFTEVGSTTSSYQLQSDSLNRISFELTAFYCAALLHTDRNSPQLQDRSVQSFQLTKQQLSRGFVQGGAFHNIALQKTASSTSLHCTALHWISLSLAQDAWLKTSSKKAWRTRTLIAALALISLSVAQVAWLKTSSLRASHRRSLRRSLCTTSLSTTAWKSRSSHRPFRQALTTRASRTTSTLRPFRTRSSLTRTLCSMLWFSFLFTNLPYSNSFWEQELAKKVVLTQTFVEQKLEEQLASKSFKNVLAIQLQKETLEQYKDNKLQNNELQTQDLKKKKNEKKLENNQLQKTTFEKKHYKQLVSVQLSEPVLQGELQQLHLAQLRLEDLDSAKRKQLLKEACSTTWLSESSFSTAVRLSASFSFSKKELSEQDLQHRSLEKFRAKNFGQQLSDQELQQNRSTDQQLQDNLAQTNFQQISLQQHSFEEKNVHNELSTNFAKKSLEENLPFQNLDFGNLALQKAVSREGVANLFYRQLFKSTFAKTGREACKEQLLPAGFPATSLNRQPFRGSLVQHSGAKEASHKLLQRQLQEEELAEKTFNNHSLVAPSLPTRTSPRQLEKNQLEEETFAESSFEALCLSTLQDPASKEALLQPQFLQEELSGPDLGTDSFPTSSFPAESFRTSAFQSAAFRAGHSDSQLQRQQLDRGNLQNHSLEKNNFQNSFEAPSLLNSSFWSDSFQEHSLPEPSFSFPSFRQTSFQQNSLQQDSFGFTSFRQDSFQQLSFRNRSLQPSSFEQQSFQDSSFSTSTLRTELSELPLRSLDLRRSFSRPFWKRALDSLFQRGSARGSFSLASFQLDLVSLSLMSSTSWLKTPECAFYKSFALAA